MGGQKKRASDDGYHVKRKKHKKSTVALNQMLETEVSIFETTDLLDAETIREGMLLLGCVTEIKPAFLEVSLPGLLSGRVPLNNISNPFTKSLKDFATYVEMEEPSHSFIKPGMIFPCKIMEISRDSSKKKLSITLSINPVDINADLKPSLLYPKMVLYVSVSSIEDHGCVVDVGNKYIKGFLPKQHYQDHRSEFKIGEVIPTFIKQISSDKTSTGIQLSLLDFTKPFPTVATDDIKLASILPGMKILGDVIDIKHPFIYIKYQCFDACASMLSIGPSCTAIKIGKQVSGTVLYVHPITHMIYLSLSLKPSTEYFESEYFGMRKYAIVKNLKYYSSYKKFAYYVIKKGTLGFIHVKDLPKSTSNEKVSKACVLRYHYVDNLVQLSAKSSLLEKNIIFPEDVQIGDMYEAIVSKHVCEGMFVNICPGLSGFVRKIYMSDVFITKPEVLYPAGSKVNCRVLSTDGKSKLNLTCKESLLKLKDQFILSSYENVQKGQFYKGVIAQKTHDYILVLFFNDIKGIVPSQYVPEGSILFEGQTVLCEVLYISSLRKKLKLSLQVEERCTVEEIDDFWYESTEKAASDRSNEVFSLKGELVHHQKIAHSDIDCENPTSKTNNKSILPLDQWLSFNSDEIKPVAIEIKAVIQSIKGNQLNITFNRTKGRVHITELGCTSEDTYPLKHFVIGQEIQGYVIGEFMKKKNNYLQVSHKNYIAFKECSLRSPPYTVPHDFWPGKQLMGFVKEVRDVSVLLWLSPYQIGILDYLHFSENLKTIKSLHRHLKIGLSVKVSVLENNRYTVILTKTGKTLPQPGKNTIGLVQIPCSERGLVLKLPFGYHGSVAVTDLTDVYTQVPILFKKYCKSKFLKCHVLEVNHETKYCQLSLRKSRMYGKIDVPSAQFCPEIFEDDIKVGKTIKGFVKSVSDLSIIVSLGSNLQGKIPIHTCSSSCQLCETSRSIIHKYSVGSIIEVTVKECFRDGRLCILNVTASGISKNDGCIRLDVEKDISWDE